LNSLPQGLMLTSEYFQESIIGQLAIEKYPRGREPNASSYMFHFENVFVHKTEKVEQI
jgi:hypothetical protein